jgi:predicted esterase
LVRARLVFVLALTLAVLAGLSALADDIAPIARKLPPPGIQISAEDRAAVKAAVDRFAAQLAEVRGKLSAKKIQNLLPDVEVYFKAGRFALENDEFFDKQDAKRILGLLERGQRRLEELASGFFLWPLATGTLVRGYRSRLDDSVQPYGLVIPEGLDFSKDHPLYVWLHGRGDKMTEVSFMLGRESKPGELQPAGAIVLHPFGRYCNGFKFAGEIDVLEAIEAVKKQYQITPSRVVLCGFSMGGAGAWHLGAHYADQWAAVSPGAGFAETARYQNLKPENYPAPYVQLLWGWYDVPDYTLNLFNIPVIAYSGELDKQIQAARVMEEAYAREGQKLTHLIGPGMGHKYHPDTLAQLHWMLVKDVAKVRDRLPPKITLETRTLRYNRYGPVEILGLEEHWRDARVEAVTGFYPLGGILSVRTVRSIKTRNVSALRLKQDLNWYRFAFEIDDQTFQLNRQKLDWKGRDLLLVREAGTWKEVEKYPPPGQLRKVHGLQGPIDDAFMDRFLVVLPTRKSPHEQFERWMQFELAHFLDRWKRLFRGEPRVKRDVEISDRDQRDSNMIVWGDPSSNEFLDLVVRDLPLKWTRSEVVVGEKTYSADDHALAMIYPNPLQPHHYLVINSGPTFREGHDTSNSQQTPKLPDWAVIDFAQPPDALAPGKIADAGFFDEQWQYRPSSAADPAAAAP